MSICWGLSDLPPRSFLVRYAEGWKREEEFTVIRAPHWPCIDHFRFDFMRLATLTVGENVPFYRWHGRNFRIHDTFSSLSSRPSSSWRNTNEGMMEKKRTLRRREDSLLSFFHSLSLFFLIRRRGPIWGLWKIKYPRRGLMFTCMRVSNLILNLQRRSRYSKIIIFENVFDS